MASTVVFKRGTAALVNKLFNPVRAVSAVQRSFNTSSSSQVSAYDDFNRTVEEDRRPDQSVTRRRDNDIFSDLFDPFAPTRSMNQIFNMMDQFMDNPFMAASPRASLAARRGWDAKEDNEALNLRFDMPGMDKDNVKISVEQNTLIIKAEAEKETEEEEMRRRYSTRLGLPNDVYKVDEIKAEMKNGVLKIVVPKVKAEEKKDVLEVEIK